ncbi:MAG: glucose-1-phosphate adenylyltransferase [Fibromonadaceae bacterium]|jgi:glucose-1-phosphate adenylyltransferase|nr:glucose-1-phosphate adenylyltransferase [Fibromonadaceae bacterium]
MSATFNRHNKNVLCMIMAGGQGSRLSPLTRDRAKPAVHFGGIYRIIDFVLNNFINSSVFKIKILTQFKSDSLNKHVSAAWGLNPSTGQYVDLVPAQMRTGNDWYKGTSDAIFQNINLITDERPDLVAIFGGDHIYKMDVNQMVDFHLKHQAMLTIAAIPIPVSEASEFGIIEVDENSRMIGFEEKPKSNPKQIPGRKGWCLASMGNYIFTSKFLVRQLLEIHQSNPKAIDFGHNILPHLYPSHPVYVYDFTTNVIKGEHPKTKGYWRDVGTIDAFYEANMDICASEPIFDLYNEAWPIRTFNWNMPPAKFSRGGTDEVGGVAVNSIISAGCIINGASVVNSVLSPGVTVQKGALVEDSIIFPGVTIAPGARIKKAIIEKNLHIPARFEVGYNLDRDEAMFHLTESGIVVLAKDTVIKGN